ncbi:MAG: chemotaxis protein CheD [Myxococcales bacterium]|nr:MAG: chemotaxis protein CheD [Myxococcales bacterium]
MAAPVERGLAPHDAARCRRVVGIADMVISSSRRDLVLTYALGSCLGVCVWDPVVRVGGLLHLMLPQAAMAPEKAAENPLMFADTGIPKLFLGSYALGAKKERLVVVVAGGASFNSKEDDDMAIGQRNIAMLRKLMWKNGVLLKKHELGGTEPRNMSLDIGTGEVSVAFGKDTRVLFEGSAT